MPIKSNRLKDQDPNSHDQLSSAQSLKLGRSGSPLWRIFDLQAGAPHRPARIAHKYTCRCLLFLWRNTGTGRHQDIFQPHNMGSSGHGNESVRRMAGN